MAEISRRQTLGKQERLYEKTVLDAVFQKGNTIHNSPIKLLWVIDPRKSTMPVKVAFSVPKRIFKKAVTRNLLKRRMREAYRKHKILKTANEETYALMFIYSARKINHYAEIESKIVLTLQHFKTATGAE
ncbi:MAG TPA: ribonuclease P protein component [Bacteroidia bacterium]|jgi:ribonuclease P protein component|nr:ribonuclease P protein component [Bacteroidia bacterium]